MDQEPKPNTYEESVYPEAKKALLIADSIALFLYILLAFTDSSEFKTLFLKIRITTGAVLFGCIIIILYLSGRHNFSKLYNSISICSSMALVYPIVLLSFLSNLKPEYVIGYYTAVLLTLFFCLPTNKLLNIFIVVFGPILVFTTIYFKHIIFGANIRFIIHFILMLFVSYGIARSFNTVRRRKFIESMKVFKELQRSETAEKNLEQKNREILEYSENVTHDLKKPLTVIKTVFSILQNAPAGSLNERGLEAVIAGREAVAYMQTMLEDLLACARLESGTQELEIETIGLKELTDSVVTRLKFQIEEKTITVEIPNDDLTVNADKKQLTRVLMNLVGNAVNYIGEGPDKRIRIGWEQRNGAILIFVADNGIGISLESQEHLFDKFKRGDNVSGIPGTGLGLAIVKGIIEAHGGTIWVESEIGKGSKFLFTIPNR